MYPETYKLDLHELYTHGEAMGKASRYAFNVWIRVGKQVARRTLQHGQQAHGAFHQGYHAWKKEPF